MTYILLRNNLVQNGEIWTNVLFSAIILQKGEVNMRILGIDPGYGIMGWGIVDMEGNRFKVISYGAITTDSKDTMTDRLKHINFCLMEIIKEFSPTVASIEELFFNTNITTAMKVGQARGVAMLCCANCGLDVFEYTPLQIKQALTGYGRADKKQVKLMVKTVLCLQDVPRPDDTADALAACICHGHSSSSRLGGIR